MRSGAIGSGLSAVLRAATSDLLPKGNYFLSGKTASMTKNGRMKCVKRFLNLRRIDEEKI